jgi:hypothetical protein
MGSTGLSRGSLDQTWTHGRDVTEPEEDPVTRARNLENMVDHLDEKVAREREAEGVAGKPSDRDRADIHGMTDEPPD